jgi:hypothetical protein
MNSRDECKRLAKQSVLDFVQGAATGNPQLLIKGIGALDYGQFDGGGWIRALRSVGRLPSVPDVTRKGFLGYFLSYGDHLRQELSQGLTDEGVIKGIRMLLPKYEGPAIRLFRGEQFENRRRRTYGLSWSASADVARRFAERDPFHRTSKGGSVLIETVALPEAIICAPALLGNWLNEYEYIVDRRRLTSVDVIERFAEVPIDDWSALAASMGWQEETVEHR